MQQWTEKDQLVKDQTCRLKNNVKDFPATRRLLVKILRKKVSLHFTFVNLQFQFQCFARYQIFLLFLAQAFSANCICEIPCISTC